MHFTFESQKSKYFISPIYEEEAGSGKTEVTLLKSNSRKNTPEPVECPEFIHSNVLGFIFSFPLIS